MTMLAIPTLLMALSAQAPLAPVAQSYPAGPYAAPVSSVPHHRVLRGGYAPTRRYGRSSAYRGRDRLFADNYLKKGGSTFTMRGGYHDLIVAKEGFGAMAPKGSFGYAWGWNINPFVNFGLGVDGFFYGAHRQIHGPVKGVGQINLTMDVIFRLIRPSERRYVVPFIQVGMGLALLSASAKKTEGSVDSEGEPVLTETQKSLLLSRGGLFQVGGGLEIFLTRFLSLSVRAMYRVQPMSGLRCVEGASCDPSRGLGQQNLQGFSADAGFTIHFGSF